MIDFNTMIEEKYNEIIKNPNCKEFASFYRKFPDHFIKEVHDFLFFMKGVKENQYEYSNEILDNTDNIISDLKIQGNNWADIIIKNNKYNIICKSIIFSKEECVEIIDYIANYFVRCVLVMRYGWFNIGNIEYYIINNNYNKRNVKSCKQITYKKFNKAYNKFRKNYR